MAQFYDPAFAGSQSTPQTQYGAGQFGPVVTQGFAQPANAQSAANLNGGQVLGANTGFNTGGQSNPQPQQPTNTGQDPHVNPATGRWDDNYFAQHQAQSGQPGQPGQANIDFDSMIRPAIDNYEAFIQQQQGATENRVGEINQQAQNQVSTAQANIQGEQNTLNQSQMQQQTQTGNAVEDAKRMYAEMQQGIAARYGGSTGTGAFLTDQAGQTTSRNIAQLQQGLQQNLQTITDKRVQIAEVGRLAVEGIQQQAASMVQQARDNLQQAIIKIKGDEGTLQAEKAKLAASAIQHYQDTVNNVNAQQEAYKQQYQLEQLKADNLLKLYQQHGQQIMSSGQMIPTPQPDTTQYNVGAQGAQGTQGSTADMSFNPTKLPGQQ